MKILVLVVVSLAFLWANVEAYPSPNAMSNMLLAYRFVTEGTARTSGFEDIPGGFSDWERTDGYPEYNRFALGTAVVLSPAVAIAVALGLAWQVDDADAARQMWDVLDPQWWWTIRAAVATADIRAAILVPITLIFGYLAFRTGLARPAAATAGQRIV